MAHLLFTVDAVLLVEATAALLGDFLDLGLAEVALGVLDEQTEGDEGEDNEGDDSLVLEFDLVFLLHVKVEVGGRRGQARVATRPERHNLLSFPHPWHPIPTPKPHEIEKID